MPMIMELHVSEIAALEVLDGRANGLYCSCTRRVCEPDPGSRIPLTRIPVTRIPDSDILGPDP